VDACDIFIGILRAKWGSDSGTYGSGFIEEFEPAAERRSGGNSPVIAMFFKQVPLAQLDDVGAQLKQVLDLRDRVKREHILLYRAHPLLAGRLSPVLRGWARRRGLRCQRRYRCRSIVLSRRVGNGRLGYPAWH
jgi:hypothetical protein